MFHFDVTLESISSITLKGKDGPSLTCHMIQCMIHVKKLTGLFLLMT